MSDPVPCAIVLKSKPGIMSPLTNASVGDLSAAKTNKGGGTATPMASGARKKIVDAAATKKKPPPAQAKKGQAAQATATATASQATETTATTPPRRVRKNPRSAPEQPVRKSPRAKKKQKTASTNSSTSRSNKQEDDDADYDPHFLQQWAEESNDEDDSGNNNNNWLDMQEEANQDMGNCAKQTLAKKEQIKFEKELVTLEPRQGRRIKATSFSKGFFYIPKLTEKGLTLMNTKESKLHAECCSFPVLCCV
jgi:hypothetical protein